MNCIALDDEPLALQLLAAYINDTPGLHALGFYTNPDDALQRLREGGIDVLFLDIQMPDITGLQFLRALAEPPIVIFTTAYAEYALEGFNLDAADYLLKPFDYQRFAQAISKAQAYVAFKKGTPPPDAPAATHLMVKVEYSVVQIPFEQILYIEGFDDYIRIYTGQKPIMTLMRLKNALTALPTDRFARVHRSYVVALDKIDKIRAQKITIADREIPIGESYWPKVKNLMGH
jgi:DNA-binding LytR/AlgR family response regulator